LVDVEYLLKTWKWKNKLTLLKWDGDFRSKESINLLKQSDIVVTNPPFSLFPEYLAQLVEYKKNFIIWWNNNAITYKWVFHLIKDNKLWLWYSVNKTYIFRIPNYYDKYDEKITMEKNDWFKYWKVPAISIYTNLDISKRHEDLILYKKYNKEDYPKYETIDWIDVSDVANIPYDYYWIMWVPKTFLWWYNPNQFEIIWYEREDENIKAWISNMPESFLENYRKHWWTWHYTKWMKMLCFYDKNWLPKIPFSRILIRRKK
jgi:hypothetical protein